MFLGTFQHVHVPGSPCCLRRRILKGRYCSISSSTKPSKSLKPDFQIGCTSESGSSPETFIMYKCKMTHFSLVSLLFSPIVLSQPIISGWSFFPLHLRSQCAANIFVASLNGSIFWLRDKFVPTPACHDFVMPGNQSEAGSGEVQVCRNPESWRATRRTPS